MDDMYKAELCASQALACCYSIVDAFARCFPHQWCVRIKEHQHEHKDARAQQQHAYFVHYRQLQYLKLFMAVAGSTQHPRPQ